MNADLIRRLRDKDHWLGIHTNDVVQMVAEAADALEVAEADVALLAVELDEVDKESAMYLARAEAAEARIKELERLDREAATHVESVICLRSGHFTGDPPYVGWKGLGLALNQDYDDLRAAEAEVARLKEINEAQADQLGEAYEDAARLREALGQINRMIPSPAPTKLLAQIEDICDGALAAALHPARRDEGEEDRT